MEGLAAVLQTEGWTRLAASGVPRTFAPGQPMLHQGDLAHHVLLLVRGRVKVSRVDSEGNTIVLAVRGPGELLGEIGVLGTNVRTATVTAIDRCEVRVVSDERFLDVIRSLNLEGDLLRHVIRRFSEGEDLRTELAALPSGTRVARCLLRLAAVHAEMQLRSPGADTSPNVIGGEQRHEMGVGLTQIELAQAVGLHRSTVAAELRKLRETGAIVTSQRHIVIRDVVVLRKHAGQ